MTDKQIIIDGCNVSNCKYYVENNGVEYQGLYQYTNMCYKLPMIIVKIRGFVGIR